MIIFIVFKFGMVEFVNYSTSQNSEIPDKTSLYSVFVYIFVKIAPQIVLTTFE